MAARSGWWLRVGVVGLGSQGGPELDAGLVVAAAFADRLVDAVGVDGSVAPAVGEHAAVLDGELVESLFGIGARCRARRSSPRRWRIRRRRSCSRSGRR